MRNFRVRLSTTVSIERFVTVGVADDAHNPDMIAMVMADQEGRKSGEFWTVLGSSPDRLGDLETVRIADMRRLPSSVSVTDPTELRDGAEVLRVSAKGSERVAFFPENPDDFSEHVRLAEAELDNRRRSSGARVSYILQDTFGA